MPPVRIRRPFVGQNQIEDSDPANPREAEIAKNCIIEDGVIKKRPGISAISTLGDTITGDIRGMYNWEKESGTAVLLFVAGTSLYYKEFTNAVTEITSSLPSSSGRVDFVAFKDRVYFCDENCVLQATDGTSVYDALEFPDTWADVTLAPSAGKALAPGRYSFTMTWYSTTWGIETNAYPIEDGHILEIESAKQADGTYYGERPAFEIPASRPDDRFDRVRVYVRREDIDGSDWEYIKANYSDSTVDADGFIFSVAGGNTYYLNLDKWSIDINRTAPLQVNYTLKHFSILKLHNGVLFGAGVVNFPNTLYYSDVDKPWAINKTIEVGGTEGGKITSLTTRDGILIVWKTREIWGLYGNTVDTFESKMLVNNVGAIGRDVIASDGKIDYFLSINAVYTFDGSGVEKISDEIDDIFDSLYYLVFTVAVYDIDRDQVVWGFASYDSDLPQAICYSIKNSRITGRNSWIFYYCSAIYFTISCSQRSSVLRENLYCSDYSDEIFCFGAHNVDDVPDTDPSSTPIELYWQTKRIDGGYSTLKKRWKSISVEIKKQDNGTPLRIGYILDDDDHVNWLRESAQKEKRILRPINRFSYDIRIVFEHTGADRDVEIHGFNLEAELLEEY